MTIADISRVLWLTEAPLLDSTACFSGKALVLCLCVVSGHREVVEAVAAAFEEQAFAVLALKGRNRSLRKPLVINRKTTIPISCESWVYHPISSEIIL